MAAVAPWTRFRVGKPSTRSNWTNSDCQPLTEVAHVMHTSVALRVLEDEALKAGLIYDKSKLNTERVSVVWLSPNDWGGAGGSRYGGMRVQFDFTKLIEGRNYYWVESVAYGIPASRILVTAKDRSAMLTPYDPTVGDGPWWYDVANQKHYWNGDHCLELMYEGDLKLSDATQIDCVSHHGKRCCNDWRTCPEAGMLSHDAAARVLCGVLSRGLNAAILGWVELDGTEVVPKYVVRSAFLAMRNDLLYPGQSAYLASVAGGDPVAPGLVRAVAGAFLRDEKAEAREIIKLFADKDAFDLACATELGAVFNFADPARLLR